MNCKHAYLLMIHDDFYTLSKLLRLIDDNRNDIFIHIDIKSELNEEALESCIKLSKIYFIKRIDVRWAEYSMVACEIMLLKEASKNCYKYYHLLSGADLPLKSQSKIHRFLANKNYNYLHFSPAEPHMNFIKYYHFFQRRLTHANRSKRISLFKLIDRFIIFLQKLISVDRRDESVTYKKGANWFSITHFAVIEVLKKEKWISKNFKLTRSPDEFFLQTVLYNSDLSSSLIAIEEDNNYMSCFRLIDWDKGNPYIFREKDYDAIKSTDAFFGRKFNSLVDQKIIDKVYEFVKQEA